MPAKFMVQWVKRGARRSGRNLPIKSEAAGPFPSFEAAHNFALTDGGPVNARTVLILRDTGEGINAGKFFLDFIVK